MGNIVHKPNVTWINPSEKKNYPTIFSFSFPSVPMLKRA